MEKLEGLTTKYLGRNYLDYQELESTQELAKKLAKQNVPNGTLILAESQTKGRGTRGRKWYTGEKGKNLACTFILYPNCSIQKLEGLTIEIAKCMVDTIWNLYQVPLQIKSPNDLMINGKKVGGILTETTVLGGQVYELFIGIGMNINGENLPEEITKIATSLKIEYQREFPIKNIICEFCNKFEETIERLLI